MIGLSERQYAARTGLSRGAIQKAKLSGRLALHADGSIDAAASDALRAAATDPAKSRRRGGGAEGADAVSTEIGATQPKSPAPAPRLKPVPEAAMSAVRETLQEQGLAAPAVGGGMTFLQARTANEMLKAQERKMRLQKLKGELVDRARSETLTFRLAREARDAWITWPARVAALMAAEVSAGIAAGIGKEAVVAPALMQKVLEAHVRAELESLAGPGGSGGV